MVPISITITASPEPFRYDLSSWTCKNAVIKQIIGQSQDDLNVQIKIIQKHGGTELIEHLKFGRQLSPTSFETYHLIEDCSKTYLEITSTSSARLMLLYE
ncbi:MAG: hypothetical protein EOO03_14760 [Chitinophagaceae bacterium]|nr:MAG: hypothetical protein EOO03_14760 [Chitinophagaceae bacterium]